MFKHNYTSKKIVMIMWAMLIICLLNSCFTINEYITFKKNGSGSVKTTIDMSNMMQMLGMFLPDSIKQTMKMDDLLTNEPGNFKKIEGIKNTKISSDKEYVYTISYDFDNVKALNKAMNMLRDEESIMAGFNNFMKNEYTFKRGKVSRKTNINTNSIKELENFNIQESKEMFQFMNSPTYNVTYELPRDIKKINTKNEKSSAEKGKNTVTMRYDLFNFLEAKGEVINHDIKF